MLLWFGTHTGINGKSACSLCCSTKTGTNGKDTCSYGVVQAQRGTGNGTCLCDVVQAQKLRENVYFHVVWYKHRN